MLGDDGPMPYEEAWLAAERAVRPLLAALPTRPVPQLHLRTFRDDLRARRSYAAQLEDDGERCAQALRDVSDRYL